MVPLATLNLLIIRNQNIQINDTIGTDFQQAGNYQLHQMKTQRLHENVFAIVMNVSELKSLLIQATNCRRRAPRHATS